MSKLNQTIICQTCGEESGGAGTSMYGSVHKYGPTTHEFKPSTPQTPRVVAECRTCGAAVRIPEVPVRATGFLRCPQGGNHLVPYTRRAKQICRAAGHDVRPVKG